MRMNVGRLVLRDCQRRHSAGKAYTEASARVRMLCGVVVEFSNTISFIHQTLSISALTEPCAREHRSLV